VREHFHIPIEMNRIFLILALLAGTPFTERAAAQAPVVGVGAHQLDARSVAQLRNLGVRRVRHTLYWKRWESEPRYRRDEAEAIRAATRAGFELLVVVHQQPARFGYRNRTVAYSAYAEFMGVLARAFPDVEAWELWNEMDVPGFTDVFGAGTGASLRQIGRNYGEMLRLAYPAIKRANPRAIVVTGGMASDPEDGFLQGLLDSGAPWDALGIHAYGLPVWSAVKGRAERAREILAGDHRPLWCTEFGMEEAVIPRAWPRTKADVDQWHLASWRDPIVGNEDLHLYARMYGHVLTQGGDRSYDLIRRDGSLRPAAVWLRGYLH
jgi:hypothetical protein